MFALAGGLAAGFLLGYFVGSGNAREAGPTTAAPTAAVVLPAPSLGGGMAPGAAGAAAPGQIITVPASVAADTTALSAEDLQLLRDGLALPSGDLPPMPEYFSRTLVTSRASMLPKYRSSCRQVCPNKPLQP